MSSSPQPIPANASTEFQSTNAPAPSATTPSSSEQATLSGVLANPTTIVAASPTAQVAHASASASSLPSPTKIDYALAATTTTLTGLKAIPVMDLVPGLSQAAGTASQLLDMLMTKRQNDEGIRDLAKDISGLILCIYEACNSDSDTRAVSQEFSQDVIDLSSCLQSLGEFCTRYQKRRWIYRFIFSLLWKFRIEDVRRKVQECIRRFELKNAIFVRKFHDVWRQANHATTSQLKTYIDAVVSNPTQGLVETRPQNEPRPSFVDNSYTRAMIRDNARAYNGGIIGFEQTQVTPNPSLPTAGISNAFQGAEISDAATTYNYCVVSKHALQWGGPAR